MAPVLFEVSGLKTAVPMTTCFAGAAGALIAIVVGILITRSPALVTVLLVLGGALPMWLLEWRRYRGRGGGQTVHADARVALMGVAGLVVLFAVLIWLQLTVGGEKGAAVSEVSLPLLLVALGMLPLALFRPIWLGSGVIKLGTVVQRCLGRRSVVDGDWLIVRSWLVRAFFLPLMMGWAYLWVAGAMEGLRWSNNWLAIFSGVMALLYAIDTSFAVIGYLVANERLGSHVRSVDASWAGWLSALCCYPPLSVLVLGQWLVYKDGLEWRDWILPGSTMSLLWGGAILLLTGIYVWATVVFGPRFSNLTHRGIVTAGPYRWCRHPAYLSKNLSWWLISVPFFSEVSVQAAIAHCIALLGVNAIYWARALTEERHLSHDPEYVAYSKWVDECGALARLRSMFRWGR